MKNSIIRQNIEGRKQKVIVSLTSFPTRIDDLWLVINSILRQTFQPDKVILWLSKQQFSGIEDLPESLKGLVGDLFEIIFVENDYRSHKKYLYAFKDYPDDFVILIDDDIIYRNDLIERLVYAANIHLESIVCNYGCEIQYDKTGDLAPYNSWKSIGLKKGINKRFFFGSGGGTLFRPKQLCRDVLDIKLAKELAPIADDIWLNAMVRMSHLSIYYLNLGEFVPLNGEGEALFDLNISQNDIQLRNVNEYYQKKMGLNIFVEN